MNKSDTIGKLVDALAKAQGKINHAEKEASNPAYKRGDKVSKYADLASVWDACREALASNGLAVVQTVATEGAIVRVTTVLAHASGEWISGEMSATAAGPDAQKVGSATTYLRRYSLASMVGVAPASDDDDGNKASDVNSEAGRAPAKTAPRAAQQIDLAKRKKAAIEFLRNKLGETAMRKGLGDVLGRLFPPLEDIKFHTEAELAKVEGWVEINRAANNAEQRGDA